MIIKIYGVTIFRVRGLLCLANKYGELKSRWFGGVVVWMANHQQHNSEFNHKSYEFLILRRDP